ncbi:MAG: hypothetical protein JXR20_02970 [Balneola sp.]
MRNIATILATILFISISSNAFSQHKVTFNINLKPQLEDSVFIPNRDAVYLVGSTYPLRMTRPLTMKDEAPVDSIYTVEVNFNRNQMNAVVEYNFILRINSNQLKEDRTRSLNIRGDEILDALYFNAFAW